MSSPLIKKIYCLQSHPIQYFSPLFQAIAAKGFCNFKVFYCSDSSVKGYFDRGFGSNIKWDIPLLEGYPSQFLKNYSPKPGTNLKLFNLINPGIIKVILKDKPDIVWLHGWSYLTIWFAIMACKISGTKIWMKSESPLNQELVKSKQNRFLKKIFLQHFLFKLIDKFLYIGTENKEFYQHYKVPDHKLIFSPYAIDNDRFSKAFHKLKSEKNKIKEQLNIPLNSIVLLFSGKLISKKRPLDLLDAFKQLNDPNLFLIFLGDGELKTTIEEEVKINNIENVKISGFVNQKEISNYYTMANILILPSTMGETWGLVVNEAMNFDLPVIVSDMVGCAKDLVKDDVNGYTYPVGDTKILVSKLKCLYLSAQKLESFGLASGRIVKQYSYEMVIQGIEYSLNE